jgi:PAS domain-containing protein
MSDNDFTPQTETRQQRVDALRQRATDDTGQLAEVLPKAFAELQDTIEEIQVTQEELALTRRTVEVERQRYQELFNLAPDCYLATDAQGIIKAANRAAAALLNCPQNLLMGKPLIVFVVEVERETFRTRLHRLLIVNFK